MAKLNEKRQIFRRDFSQFNTEEEVEKVVVDNFKLLFGDYSPSDLEEWVLSHALYEIVKAGLLNVGDKVHFDYGPKGKPKTHFEGKVCSDGIEVDGIVSSASISAMRCIQKINPTRTTANGWATWKTVDGKLLEEKWNALLKMNGEQVKASGKKPHKKKCCLVKSTAIRSNSIAGEPFP